MKKPLKLCAIFIDFARNLDRPGFRKMETAIQAGTINAVIVADITRIARDALKRDKWLVELQNKGILFLQPTSHITPI